MVVNTTLQIYLIFHNYQINSSLIYKFYTALSFKTGATFQECCYFIADFRAHFSHATCFFDASRFVGELFYGIVQLPDLQ